MTVKPSNKDIIFLTTTIGTRWIFYQQFLLNKFFPGSKKTLIDGNKRWDFAMGLDCVWYDFIKLALAEKGKCKYFIHVDEDCFITDPQGIYEAIEFMDANNLDIMGPADYFYGIRAANSMVVNSFLMIGKISTLDQVMSDFDIDLTFKELNIPLDPAVEEEFVEFEPYYNFFWNYMKKGFKIGNIKHEFHQKFQCTSLSKADGESFGLHMWFTRNWNDREAIPHMGGISQYQRYKQVEAYLNGKFKISFADTLKGTKNWSKFLSIQYTRLIPKNIARVKRKLSKLVSR